MEKETMVSIVCEAYNHEKYIADAIGSFLMQKTEFPFEILIHDDASTDRTAEIIREYEKKYPDIIKPIYQSENQYSKGVNVGLFNSRRATGKYLAICEGDDYWTEPSKLQKQVDYMEANPECSMCVHAAQKVSSIRKKVVSKVRPSSKSRIFTVEELIEGGGDFVATNSIVYDIEKLGEMPQFYQNAVVGDYPLVIYAALKGSVYYMDEIMSAYRIGVSGSWTDRELGTLSKQAEHVYDIASMLDEINEYTAYRYDAEINRTKKKTHLCLLLEMGEKEEARKPEYSELYKELGLKRRATLKVKHSFPRIARVLKAVKWKLIT